MKTTTHSSLLKIKLDLAIGLEANSAALET